MTKKQKYLNSEAHGYLLESDACALLIKELERACTKFQRRIDKENAARQADFDAAMEYHSENEIQDAYGWELITEAQYRAYMDLFHRGRQALEEHASTVSELALSIARRVIYDLESDQREFAFSALTPKQQTAELLRAEKARKEWKEHIARLKEQQGQIVKWEDKDGTSMLTL